jgi:c(7)-type cytochrome triheme protein
MEAKIAMEVKMMRRWVILAVLICVALPSVLYGRWIKDKVYLETEDVGKVAFSHYDHMAMESIGKNCPTCHNDIYHIVTKKNPAFTMAQMEEGQACGACHNGEQAFSVAGDCTTCHAADVAIQTENVGKVTFSHDVHNDMFGCQECHPDLFVAAAGANPSVSMAEMENGASCGACHDGDMAFGVGGDCSSCHAGDVVYQNEEAGNITFPHDAHNDMFGCEECHPDLFVAEHGANPPATMEEMENGASCGACHDGDMAFGVADDCEACHAM